MWEIQRVTQHHSPYAPAVFLPKSWQRGGCKAGERLRAKRLRQQRWYGPSFREFLVQQISADRKPNLTSPLKVSQTTISSLEAENKGVISVLWCHTLASIKASTQQYTAKARGRAPRGTFSAMEPGFHELITKLTAAHEKAVSSAEVTWTPDLECREPWVGCEMDLKWIAMDRYRNSSGFLVLCSFFGKWLVEAIVGTKEAAGSCCTYCSSCSRHVA